MVRKSMCNRLKSVNSRRNIWRFSPHRIHSSPRYVRKYRIVATATTTTTNWLHHYYQYRSWNVILLLLLLLFETQMLLFSMPSSISTSSRLPFSLSFYLFTFSIFIFIHSQQLGLPLSEQLIFMYNARARLQNRKFESISSGSDDAERKKMGKFFP